MKAPRTTHWILALTALAALAACRAPGAGFRAGSVLRSVDNDAFDDSDDQYSSGVSLAYLSAPAASFEELPLPAAVARTLEDRFHPAADDQRFVIYSLSHRLFTPTDLQARELVADDLPYSALLYGTATAGTQSRDELAAVSLTVGFVGPVALGETVQSTVHEVIGSQDPRGWDNQLENEPLLNVGFDRRKRLTSFGERTGLGGDLLGGISGSLGNLQSQATLATTLRLGYRVPTNFHMQAPFLADESLGLRPYDTDDGRLSVYGFIGAAGTALANAIYLDGNTFRDSHSVDHDAHVVRGSVGLAARWHGMVATLAYETASLPWDHPNGLDRESFVRLGVSWDF